MLGERVPHENVLIYITKWCTYFFQALTEPATRIRFIYVWANLEIFSKTWSDPLIKKIPLIGTIRCFEFWRWTWYSGIDFFADNTLPKPMTTRFLGRIFPSLIFQSWWRHQIETFSSLLAHCEMNPAVTSGFPSKRPWARSFDQFFNLRLNRQLSKQSRFRGFETIPCSLWRHSNGSIKIQGHGVWTTWIYAPCIRLRRKRPMWVTFACFLDKVKVLCKSKIPYEPPWLECHFIMLCENFRNMAFVDCTDNSCDTNDTKWSMLNIQCIKGMSLYNNTSPATLRGHNPSIINSLQIERS